MKCLFGSMLHIRVLFIEDAFFLRKRERREKQEREERDKRERERERERIERKRNAACGHYLTWQSALARLVNQALISSSLDKK